MKRLVGVGTAFGVMLCSFGGMAQEPDLVKIKPLLAQAVEEIQKSFMISDLGTKEYGALMDLSCNALSSLLEDDEFGSLLKI